MKVITTYQCEVCGTEHEDEESARICEADVLPECPLTVGQNVTVYHRYGDPEPDIVKSIRIGPFIPNVRSHCHQWLIAVYGVHQIGKECWTKEVSLSCIYVDGKRLERE